MLLQMKKNKKGVSIVIGYILLVAISIVISIVVYQSLKTYVPTEAIECPDGTSAFIKDIYYNCVNSRLNVTLKNNGKFSIAGYYIYVSNNSDEEALATTDISQDVIENLEGQNKFGNSVVFVLGENALTPNEPGNVRMLSFDVSRYGTLYKIEIIPTRWQEIEGKERFVSCTDARIDEILICD